jgi:hypothetical protein
MASQYMPGFGSLLNELRVIMDIAHRVALIS